MGEPAVKVAVDVEVTATPWATLEFPDNHLGHLPLPNVACLSEYRKAHVLDSHGDAGHETVVARPLGRKVE